MSCDPFGGFFGREDSAVEPACGRSGLVCLVRLMDCCRAISLVLSSDNRLVLALWRLGGLLSSTVITSLEVAVIIGSEYSS